MYGLIEKPKNTQGRNIMCKSNMLQGFERNNPGEIDRSLPTIWSDGVSVLTLPPGETWGGLDLDYIAYRASHGIYRGFFVYLGSFQDYAEGNIIETALTYAKSGDYSHSLSGWDWEKLCETLKLGCAPA